MNDLERIISSEKAFLTPAEAAPLLETDPQTLRMSARENPALVKFPFVFIGNRMKIPRIPFLRFLGIEVDNRE